MCQAAAPDLTTEDPAAAASTEYNDLSADQELDVTTEDVYLEYDETLLQHEYIDETYSVVTNADFYYLQVKMYNLQLLFYWTIVGMFVINRVFEAFRPAYKVSKE